jgi:hypothetical protein
LPRMPEADSLALRHLVVIPDGVARFPLID